MDRFKTLNVECKGGLNTSTDTLSYLPGEAAELINYEAGIFGGYRRISGYAKYDTTQVPTATGFNPGPILGVCVFNGAGTQTNGVIACRNNKIYFSSGNGWAAIDNGLRVAGGRYQFARYLNNNGRNIAMCDGTNPAVKWDGATYTVINGTGAPINPKYCTYFNGALVLSGYTSGGGLQAFSISKPGSDTVFDGTQGAIEISVHDNIVGIRSFRQILYIFCQRSIWQLNGTTTANYAIAPVALGIGCLAYDSIQEVNGDLVYLSADGIRTLSGTMKLNDVELGDLSKPIIDIANSVYVNAGSNPDNITSVIVRKKNQYRLFYRSTGQAQQSSLGIIGMIRPGKQTMTQFGTYISVWEWAQIQGIQCACCDSDFIGGNETVIHGDINGWVYQQETGTSFNGAQIYSSYLTAPLQLEDTEVRKLMEKLTIYYHSEGNSSIQTYTIFDLDDPNVMQPSPITLTAVTSQPTYGNAIYGTSTYASDVFFRNLSNILGSGKLVQFNFITNDTNASHSIQALSLQYRLLGRR